MALAIASPELGFMRSTAVALSTAAMTRERGTRSFWATRSAQERALDARWSSGSAASRAIRLCAVYAMRPNGKAERRACRRTSLALDGDRVRSSVVLERTCRSLPKLIESLATNFSGGWPVSRFADRRALAEVETKDAATDPAAQPRLP